MLLATLDLSLTHLTTFDRAISVYLHKPTTLMNPILLASRLMLTLENIVLVDSLIKLYEGGFVLLYNKERNG